MRETRVAPVVVVVVCPKKKKEKKSFYSFVPCQDFRLKYIIPDYWSFRWLFDVFIVWTAGIMCKAKLGLSRVRDSKLHRHTMSSSSSSSLSSHSLTHSLFSKLEKKCYESDLMVLSSSSSSSNSSVCMVLKETLPLVYDCIHVKNIFKIVFVFLFFFFLPLSFILLQSIFSVCSIQLNCKFLKGGFLLCWL